MAQDAAKTMPWQNTPRKSFFSTRPLFMGLTAEDMFWVAELLTGGVMIYANLTSHIVDNWFVGHADLVGAVMIVFAIMRLTNFYEAEVAVLAAMGFWVLAFLTAGVETVQVKNAVSTMANQVPTFSYQANIGQPRECRWFNTEKNRWLTGDPSDPKTEAGWCATHQSDQRCVCK